MENKQEIAKANLGLVHACAKRFKGRGIEYDDLFSAGCVGLLKAINNFDWDRGIKLSTYAVPVILGEIKQLFRDSGTVKVSRSLKELSLKASKISDEYLRQHGEEITVNKLAEILETEPDRVVQALNASRLPVSLNNLDRDGDEYVTDIPVDSVEEKLSEIISLRQAVKDLEEEDKKLIILRYYKHMTQTQTAKVLNITQVQVSRREKKILANLRNSLAV
ncbi:MAG TPA: sigma-70 family RNA polymerase sigma factor [Candidatus Limousia pullorum]|uniref:Sigma-70 family RNA polymerase sigma factor n=1 Tax=Candidatus Limousia pullorum TaxID=2840860 RepID=A0A9D1LYS0_9FIRM|nr:sigma-70 family RNA polymerase sigma factor [Anaeromassilibacillus sp.]MDY3779344.1 sigma-70 family RNA polymerase sigma factor [Candidatus Limousia pullorum]MEE0762399.1 sigma-70 family RNA polymerase sigma factor [Acutalibacteraceae bacterium]HIU50549.1 sigma-70 family RNA polymerase sigma factor [Candidatus Limousia pullorum]